MSDRNRSDETDTDTRRRTDTRDADDRSEARDTTSRTDELDASGRSGTRDAGSRTDAAGEDPDRRFPNPGEHGKGLSAIVALLGVWMILEAVLVDLTAAQMWNDALVGMLLLGVGAYNYSRRSDKRLGSMPAAMLVAILGLWLIAAPFVIGLGAGFQETVNDIGFWNDIVVGLIVFGLGAYSAYEIRDRQQDVRRTPTT